LRQYSNILLAVLGALLLWAAWPVSSFTFLIFFALVPLLRIEDKVTSAKKLLGLTYLHMLLWNAFTTWWIYNASLIGAGMAIFANSFIMCLPWLLMHSLKKKFGRWAGYISLIAFWVSFEHFHHRWELSWPWLTLGNAFAMQPAWVQWYEATGTTGGSLWVLISNILCYSLLYEYRSSGRTKRYFAFMGALIALLIVPILISRNILNKESEAIALSKQRATKNVVVVQPNVDPYEEKFDAGTLESQVQRLIQLSEQQIDSNTAFVLWPETAIPIDIWEDEIQENFYYQPVWSFLSRHPNLSLLSGLTSKKSYGSQESAASETARFYEEGNFYYDVFNAAAMMYPNREARFYHKAKLVPGVETLPSFLLWLGGVFDDFGGTSGTLGRDKERVALPDAQHYYVAAPVICYESIYSDYITGYIRKGANLLTIMTNDGWWDDTPGYKQHMNYARLRAIETRRWIARSANTGISCFIDPAGNVYQPQPWDTAASIKMNIEPLQELTFFVKYGDYLSRLFNIVSVIFLLILLIVSIRQRFTSKTTQDE
jgi:apolipoprotein N-acyltransferase